MSNSTPETRTTALQLALGSPSNAESKLLLAKAFDGYIADGVDFDLLSILVQVAPAPTIEVAPEATPETAPETAPEIAPEIAPEAQPLSE